MTARELMSRVVLLAVAVCGAGVLMVLLGATQSMSRYIYLTVDIPGFAVCILALGIVTVAVRERSRIDWLEKLPVWLIALATLAVSIIGTHLVFHGYAFSPDEWMPRLQAEIFRTGALAGTVPPEWREYGRAIYHGFAYYDPATGHVASTYRPGMAALIALFDLVGLGLYVSAFLLAGSVLLVASLARQMWPESKSAPVIAALLVATSSQALVAAMTSYAMGPHLFFNLLWLRLFLHGKWWSHVAAAACGIFTASLHQIHPHLFFAAPFFLLLLKPFRPGLLAWYAAAYAGGHLALLNWDRLVMGDSLALAKTGHLSASQFVDRLERIVQLPSLTDWASIVAHLSRWIGWQSLPLLIFALFLPSRRVWTPLLVLLAVSIGTTLLPYPFIVPDQGHGWGYRYLHGLIGSAALIGTAGWLEMERRFPEHFRGAVMLSFAASLLIVFPAWAYLVERTVRPWLMATQAAASIDADVVIVDSLAIYYGHEIPRTGPFAAERPVVLSSMALSVDQTRALCNKYRVAYFGPEDGKRAGLMSRNLDTAIDARSPGVSEPEYRKRIEEVLQQSRLLASPACNTARSAPRTGSSTDD